MVNAIYVLEQAEQSEIFQLSDRASPRFNFSHLYTALSRAPYMRFLGLEVAWSRFDPTPNPVSQEKLSSLCEVLRWLYGSREEGIEPLILSQNPDIRRLGDVLENSEGLSVLRASGSLTDAHLSTYPANQRFSESLLRARKEVREASNNLRGFDGREPALVGIAEDISETGSSHAHSNGRKSQGSRDHGTMSPAPYLPADEFCSSSLADLDLAADFLELKALFSENGQCLSEDIVGCIWNSQLRRNTLTLMLKSRTARKPRREP